jgi:hypothetical protein
LKKDKDVLRKKKGALGSKKVMYFRTKFECCKIIYFGIEGISSLRKLTLKTKDQNTDGHVLEKEKDVLRKEKVHWEVKRSCILGQNLNALRSFILG